MSSGKTDIGFVPIKKSAEKTSHAIKKFITTPAEIIINFFQSFALTKLSASLFSLAFVPSSPLSETNPPRGIQLSVYSVPDLSFRRVQIFGGIPSQNSFTCTPDFFAAVKCPSSCKTTRRTNVNIPSIIQSISPNSKNK